MSRPEFDVFGDDPDSRFAPRQLELFSTASALRADVIEALARVDGIRALALVARAREAGPADLDLDVWESAARWLAGWFADGGVRSGGSHADRARPLDRDVRAAIAAAFLELPRALRRGAISRGAFDLVDEALARIGLRSISPAFPFVDDGERVHVGALALVRGQDRPAYDELNASLRSGCERRADLWASLGDARIRLRDEDGVGECFVRALILDAGAIDWARSAHEALAALFERIACAYPEAVARERLLVEAWLEGVLDIPAANGWIDLATLDDLRARSTDAGGDAARMRRFALLFYLDRSRGEGVLADREEMEALDRELLVRCVAAMERGVGSRREARTSRR